MERLKLRLVIHWLAIVAISFAAMLTRAAGIEPTSDSFVCEFTKFHYVTNFRGDIDAPDYGDFSRNDAWLEVVEGETTRRTLSLDGSVRATNAKHWYRTRADGTGTVYASDDGEILTLKVDDTDTAEKLVRRASLQYGGPFVGGHSYIFSGYCALTQ